MSNLSNDQKRIGINLDQSILGSDEMDSLFSLKAFAMAQREQGSQLFLLSVSDGDNEKMAAAFEENGMFKDITAGGFGFAKDDVILTPDKSSGLAKIKELNLSHYIYQTEGLAAPADLPESTQPIRLGQGDGFSLTDWNEIQAFFTWQHGLRNQTISSLTSIETIKEKGDNFLYRLNTADGSSYILKHYHEDCQDAQGHLKTEFNHLTALHKCGITDTPQPLWHEGSRAIYTHLEGEVLSDPSDQDIEEMASMLVRLDAKRDELLKEDIADAEDARICLQDYIDALSNKWNKVMAACQRPDGPKDIMLFMMTDLEQLRQDTLNHFYLWCKRENWDKAAPLATEHRIFSPVDFGAHNTLKTKEGKLCFLDFEQSGWDDPARLMADFFYNTEQELTMAHKLKILEIFAKDRGDEKFMDRFWAVSDMVTVEWILKLLSVAIPEEGARLQQINPRLDYKQLVKDNFKRACKMREEFQPMEHLCKHDQLLEGGEDIK